MNYSDSERLDAVLQSLRLTKTEDLQSADLVIYNTCSIKQHAEDRVFGAVHNAKKAGKIVGLTGCMVKQTSTQQENKDSKDPLLSRINAIDFVFRIEDMKNIPELLHVFDSTLQRPQIEFDEFDYLNISPELTHSFRAFVPIMTGCDKFCTYCIVPFTRGKERSRSFQDIIQECKKHVSNGVQEITLVGQNVNAYFLDDSTRKTLQRQTDFALLLQEVASIPGLSRVRFTSPHPRHMAEDILDVMEKHPNIARNLHLPVQSGSTRILQKMGREHNIQRFQDFTSLARKRIPNITFTTDIIVGFCDETEEDFQQTMDLFDQEQFLIAYISKYSPRKGTVSADMMNDTVSLEEKKSRYSRLNEKLSETSRNQNRKAIGTIEEVLVEKSEKGFAEGKSHYGRSVRFPVGKDPKRFIGKIIPVKILTSTDWSVEGEMV